ncbi:hypothetical protein DFP72DRAFT_436497 [Ephemerocybe angulata]|uniref:Uncharacterized protein n=1 Tax=Ephemerocybe angulata TaxID=980116 RepID=A0A8H6HV10_9AGAR|nr:hypothetical protein DFP72DRAFT_436497 [Tulosesus angulatus]
MQITSRRKPLSRLQNRAHTASESRLQIAILLRLQCAWRKLLLLQGRYPRAFISTSSKSYQSKTLHTWSEWDILSIFRKAVCPYSCGFVLSCQRTGAYSSCPHFIYTDLQRVPTDSIMPCRRPAVFGPCRRREDALPLKSYIFGPSRRKLLRAVFPKACSLISLVPRQVLPHGFESFCDHAFRPINLPVAIMTIASLHTTSLPQSLTDDRYTELDVEH